MNSLSYSSDYILSIALTHLGSYIVFKIIFQIAMRFRSQLTKTFNTQHISFVFISHHIHIIWSYVLL